jgi:cytochrome c oxidase subunit 2
MVLRSDLTLVLVFVTMIVLGFYALEANIMPPSNVETIDSVSLHLSDEFAEDKLGVKTNPDGTVTVTMVAARYGFFPEKITVPQDTPVTIRIASADVLHGLHAPGTNFNTMVVPGYVSKLTTEFPRAGDYVLMCNEYCGLGHNYMWSRLIIVPKDRFKPGSNG